MYPSELLNQTPNLYESNDLLIRQNSFLNKPENQNKILIQNSHGQAHQRTLDTSSK